MRLLNRSKIFFVPGLFAGYFCSKITQSPPPPSNVKWSAAKLGLCRPATQNILTFFRRLCVSEEVGLCDCGSSLITEVDINKFRSSTLVITVSKSWQCFYTKDPSQHLSPSIRHFDYNKQTNKQKTGRTKFSSDGFFFEKS